MKINQLPHCKHIHEFCTTDFVVSIFVKYFDQVINFSVINFLSKVVQSFFQLARFEKCSDDSLLDKLFFHLPKKSLKKGSVPKELVKIQNPDIRIGGYHLQDKS